LGCQGPVQIHYIDKKGLVSNSNNTEEFRIGSNGGTGWTLLGESEELSEKTTKV
jgi:hypothetical protein